jgi:hypothetical protein
MFFLLLLHSHHDVVHSPFNDYVVGNSSGHDYIVHGTAMTGTKSAF